MTPKQIKSHADRMVRLLQIEQPATTFLSLRARADEAFGTDEGRILDAVVFALDARSDAAKSAYEEFSAVNCEIVDANVVCENMTRGIDVGSVDYWPEFFRHSVAVAVCNSQVSGIPLNWTPAARCVY